MIQVVDQSEKLVSCRLNLHPGCIGEAEQNKLSLVYAAFYIFIMNTIHFYLTIKTFKILPIGMIRKIKRNADFKEVGFIKMLVIDPGFQLAGMMLIGIIGNEAVPNAIEQQQQE